MTKTPEETLRLFAHGEATEVELDAARDAAWDAWAAARAAAWAARAAAWNAQVGQLLKMVGEK